MNNKILAALALTTALATGANAACQINSGAYVGLSVGGAHLGGKNDFSHYETGHPNDVLSNNGKLSSTSMAAALFGGYGLKFNTLWVAAELMYQFDKLESKNVFRIISANGDKVLTSKSNGAFGGAIHAGFIVNNNCVIYAIAGIESRRFKVEFNDNANPTDIIPTIKKSYTSTAFVPGLGIKVNLSKNLAIRTEYKYAMHRSKTFDATAANPIHGPGVNDVIKVKSSPIVHSLNVGLVYSF